MGETYTLKYLTELDKIKKDIESFGVIQGFNLNTIHIYNLDNEISEIKITYLRTKK